MRVAIVENTCITHHGLVGVALHEAGALIDLYKPWRGNALPGVDADALVVFGGEQSALDDAAHPYLAGLAQLMAEYTAADRPVLGICLGAQLRARGFGAENLLSQTFEFGWCEIGLTEPGRADPVLGHLPPVFRIFEWHTDTFALPAGAVHLALSDKVPMQAFRMGRASYGMQFHFEASQRVVADWNHTFPDLVEANHPGWLAGFRQEAAAKGALADLHGLAIARAWVGLI